MYPAASATPVIVPVPAVVREVEPGELIAVDENGLRTHLLADLDRVDRVVELTPILRPAHVTAGAS